ncbi:MAG: hypothetical protein SGPRY_013720 [Prymnesium sp.]
MLPSEAASLEARLVHSVTLARKRLDDLQTEMRASQERETRKQRELQARCDSLTAQLQLETAHALTAGEVKHHAERSAAAAAAALLQEGRAREAVEESLQRVREQYDAELRAADDRAADLTMQVEEMRRRAAVAEAEVEEVRGEAERELNELRERVVSVQRRSRAAELAASAAAEEQARGIEQANLRKQQEASSRAGENHLPATCWLILSLPFAALEKERARLAESSRDHMPQLRALATQAETWRQRAEEEREKMRAQQLAQVRQVKAFTAHADSLYDALVHSVRHGLQPSQLRGLISTASLLKRSAQQLLERNKALAQEAPANLPPPPHPNAEAEPPISPAARAPPSRSKGVGSADRRSQRGVGGRGGLKPVQPKAAGKGDGGKAARHAATAERERRETDGKSVLSMAIGEAAKWKAQAMQHTCEAEGHEPSSRRGVGHGEIKGVGRGRGGYSGGGQGTGECVTDGCGRVRDGECACARGEGTVDAFARGAGAFDSYGREERIGKGFGRGQEGTAYACGRAGGAYDAYGKAGTEFDAYGRGDSVVDAYGSLSGTQRACSMDTDVYKRMLSMTIGRETASPRAVGRGAAQSRQLPWRLKRWRRLRLPVG